MYVSHALQLDGFIARNWASQASKLGSFLDPMADKLLVGALVISLSYCNLFPVWLCAMIIFRDVFLIVAGFVIRYISLPPPVSSTLTFYAGPNSNIIYCFANNQINSHPFSEQLQGILMQRMLRPN